jgi:hypothetical protein
VKLVGFKVQGLGSRVVWVGYMVVSAWAGQTTGVQAMGGQPGTLPLVLHG